MDKVEFEKVLRAKAEAKKVYDSEVPTLLQQFKPFTAKNGIIRAYYDSNYHYVVKVKDVRKITDTAEAIEEIKSLRVDCAKENNLQYLFEGEEIE